MNWNVKFNFCLVLNSWLTKCHRSYTCLQNPKHLPTYFKSALHPVGITLNVPTHFKVHYRECIWDSVCNRSFLLPSAGLDVEIHDIQMHHAAPSSGLTIYLLHKTIPALLPLCLYATEHIFFFMQAQKTYITKSTTKTELIVHKH